MKRFLMAIFLAGCMVGDPTAGGGGGGGGGAGSGVMTGAGSDGGSNAQSGSGNGSGAGSGGTAQACTGAAYDPCTTNAQCTSGQCQTFGGAGLEVCTVTCTPGDNTTCPAQGGQPATCNNKGICKPAQANACTR